MSCPSLVVTRKMRKRQVKDITECREFQFCLQIVQVQQIGCLIVDLEIAVSVCSNLFQKLHCAFITERGKEKEAQTKLVSTQSG